MIAAKEAREKLEKEKVKIAQANQKYAEMICETDFSQLIREAIERGQSFAYDTREEYTCNQDLRNKVIDYLEKRGYFILETSDKVVGVKW